jgi:hypothetical protein
VCRAGRSPAGFPISSLNVAAGCRFPRDKKPIGRTIYMDIEIA